MSTVPVTRTLTTTYCRSSSSFKVPILVSLQGSSSGSVLEKMNTRMITETSPDFFIHNHSSTTILLGDFSNISNSSNHSFASPPPPSNKPPTDHLAVKYVMIFPNLASSLVMYVNLMYANGNTIPARERQRGKTTATAWVRQRRRQPPELTTPSSTYQIY